MGFMLPGWQNPLQSFLRYVKKCSSSWHTLSLAAPSAWSPSGTFWGETPELHHYPWDGISIKGGVPKGCSPWTEAPVGGISWFDPSCPVALWEEESLKERCLLKSTHPPWDLLASSSNLKILLSDIKDKIYKHESGYYGLITGLVVVTLGNLSGALTRAE